MSEEEERKKEKKDDKGHVCRVGYMGRVKFGRSEKDSGSLRNIIQIITRKRVIACHRSIVVFIFNSTVREVSLCPCILLLINNSESLNLRRFHLTLQRVISQ